MADEDAFDGLCDFCGSDRADQLVCDGVDEELNVPLVQQWCGVCIRPSLELSPAAVVAWQRFVSKVSGGQRV